MTIEQINPHVRFAMTFKYPLKATPLIAYDSHMYYIIKGEGSLTTGGKTELFTEGCVINIPAGIDYLFESDSEIRCICINYDYTKCNSVQEDSMFPKELDDFCPERISEAVNFEDHPKLNCLSVFHSAEQLMEKFEKIEAEFISKKHLFREIASALLKEIIIELLRISISGRRADRKINRVLLYIHEHFNEDITNERLANIFGYHPYHLNRLMKASLGTTLHQYLVFYRIEMAKRFLTDTEQSVSEISRISGYNSFSNFSRDFKKRTGFTPLTYREISKKR